MGPGDICVAVCQVLFLAANVVFLGAGGFLLGLGIYTVTDERVPTTAVVHHAQLQKIGLAENATEEVKFVLKVLSVGAIIVGTWVTLLGALGIIGVILGSKCVLFQYANFMVCSFLASLSLGFLTAYAATKLEDRLKNGYIFVVRKLYDVDKEANNPFSRIVDKIQIEFSCCGMDNYTEFMSYHHSEENNNSSSSNLLPLSCCKLDKGAYKENGTFTLNDVSCLRYPTPLNSYVQSPCYPKIRAWLDRLVATLTGAWILILSIQLFLVAMALALSLLG